MKRSTSNIECGVLHALRQRESPVERIEMSRLLDISCGGLKGGAKMANAKLRFYFREPTIDTNLPITDGSVKIDGFDWEFVDNENDADAWDCGFAARVRAHAQGRPHISIPAFPNRKFRLAYIFVNSKAGIETPKDLEGKRLGIMQWDNTAGVWARGALQHYYGVDLHSIDWLAPRVRKEGVAEGIRIQKLEGTADADTMLDNLL